MMRLTWAPDLVEETVLLAEPSMPSAERHAFRRERDPIYEIVEQDVRDARFHALHRQWFRRLGVHDAVERAVAESLDASPIDDGRVLRAVSSHDEGADLVDVVPPGQRVASPILVVRLRPAVLLDPTAVQRLLRHELMHVRDMLDPAFGYARSLGSDTGPLTETMLRDRYRVLWDATIDGRLARAGRRGGEIPGARRREFEAVFSMLGPGARDAFDAWFDCDRPTHTDLLAFARTPSSSTMPGHASTTGSVSVTTGTTGTR
jgi:hypothetical protein